MVAQARLTATEFDRIAALPENADKRLEFVGGEVVELVSTNYSSMIAAQIAAAIVVHVQTNKLGYVTGADGYMVSGERYIPDVAFISKQRQPKPSHDTYNPNAPDLTVEVVSPSDLPKDIIDKVANYLAAGTRVWMVYPDKQQIKIFEPGQPVKTIAADGLLNADDVLPGLTIKVSDIFAGLDE